MIKLFSLILLATAAFNAAADTSSRNELVTAVINKIPSVASAQKELKPIDEAGEKQTIEDSVENIRKTAPGNLPPEYWSKVRSVQEKFITAINRLGLNNLEDHKASIKARLEAATNEELLEMATAEDLGKNKAFQKYLKSTAVLLTEFFSITNERSRALMSGYVSERKKVDVEFKGK
jgi:hypothetical protein